MSKKVLNLIIAFAAFSVILVILATCSAAPPATPGAFPQSTAAPRFSVLGLHMTDKTWTTPGVLTCTDFTEVRSFALNQPIYATWREDAPRGSESITVYIEKDDGNTDDRDDVILTRIPDPAVTTKGAENCVNIPIGITLPPGNYRTAVDEKFRVTPVPWSVK